MATVADVLRVADSQVGYVEGGGPDGRSGNITKYWAQLAPWAQGQPWCAAFVRWVDLQAKAVDLPVANPYYCPSIQTYARQHGLWLGRDKGSPGDLVIFGWQGNGVADHVGRIEKVASGEYITVEGNTSSSDVGSQRNGGGVYRRTRAINSTILGVVDYSRLLSTGTPPPRNPVKANPFAVYARYYVRAGDTGYKVKFVQWAVGVPVDGVFGAQTTYAVKQFQHYHGLQADGVVGALTLGVLRLVTH